MNDGIAAAAIARLQSDIDGLRRVIVDQEQAIVAERAARRRAERVIYACQDMRQSLPGAVLAALEMWEEGGA